MNPTVIRWSHNTPIMLFGRFAALKLKCTSSIKTPAQKYYWVWPLMTSIPGLVSRGDRRRPEVLSTSSESKRRLDISYTSMFVYAFTIAMGPTAIEHSKTTFRLHFSHPRLDSWIGSPGTLSAVSISVDDIYRHCSNLNAAYIFFPQVHVYMYSPSRWVRWRLKIRKLLH